MKKRIGNLRGKPIIEGDKNLMTSNEVHVSELGGGGAEEDNDTEYEYIAFDMYQNQYINAAPIMYTFMTFASSVELYDSDNNKYFAGGGILGVEEPPIQPTHYVVRMKLRKKIWIEDTIVGINGYITKEEYISYMCKLYGSDVQPSEVFPPEVLKQITKEEFYNSAEPKPRWA